MIYVLILLCAWSAFISALAWAADEPSLDIGHGDPAGREPRGQVNNLRLWLETTDLAQTVAVHEPDVASLANACPLTQCTPAFHQTMLASAQPLGVAMIPHASSAIARSHSSEWCSPIVEPPG